MHSFHVIKDIKCIENFDIRKSELHNIYVLNYYSWTSTVKNVNSYILYTIVPNFSQTMILFCILINVILSVHII